MGGRRTGLISAVARGMSSLTACSRAYIRGGVTPRYTTTYSRRSDVRESLSELFDQTSGEENWLANAGNPCSSFSSKCLLHESVGAVRLSAVPMSSIPNAKSTNPYQS